MRPAPGKPARSPDPGPYRAIPCPCGHRACSSWMVDPVAAVQGVRFTQEQAEAVAALLGAIQTGTFGGLISFMISSVFQQAEIFNPDADHRFYMECRLCGGTDEARPKAIRPSVALVSHGGACTLNAHLIALKSMMAGNVTATEKSTLTPTHHVAGLTNAR